MTTEQGNGRWQEIKSIHRDYRFFYQMAAGIAFVILGILIGFALFPNDIGYRGNLYTTILGVVITILVLDRRAEQRAERALKVQLIREMGSTVNEVARRAVEELQDRGWSEDGSLRKQMFRRSNLQGVRLGFDRLTPQDFENPRRPDLEESNFRLANLADAKLYRVNFQKCNLIFADLRNANFYDADLQFADLTYADLQGASLKLAAADHANFTNANLRNVRLDENGEKVRFGVNTILPDGSLWTPETDMRRFTDPNHPDFWRSDDPNSPAYREKQGT